MFTRYGVTTYRLMIFLVAFSGLGGVISGQLYYALQFEETLELARQTSEEVFLSTIGQAGGQSSPEITKRVAQRQMMIKGIYSSAVSRIRFFELWAMMSFIGWWLVLVVSGVALILSGNKKSNQSDSDVVPAQADSTSIKK